MKILTPTLHGLGDYAAALVLIVGPYFLGIKEQSVIAYWASIAGGIGPNRPFAFSTIWNSILRARYKN